MKCKSKSESYFDEFRESIDNFSKARDAAYENCNLPSFLYWHLLSGLCHPLCKIEMPYKKYGRHYDAAYRLRQLAGDKIRSTSSNNCMKPYMDFSRYRQDATAGHTGSSILTIQDK